MKKQKIRIKNKKNFFLTIVLIILIIILFILLIIINSQKEELITTAYETLVCNFDEKVITKSIAEKIVDNSKLNWDIVLVNHYNKLPDNFNIILEDIDEYRKFDKRAIEKLNKMIVDARKQSIGIIWVQSAYRSVETQKQIYNNKVQEYINKGKTKKEAQKLTEETINKPGYSEHNLGLAVDFNYVNNEFEKTKVFDWLKKNAENYGFILRYPKEKEDITKVKYEPWHWRYVGIENAKKINELGFCLEEYIDYISN